MSLQPYRFWRWKAVGAKYLCGARVWPSHVFVCNAHYLESLVLGDTVSLWHDINWASWSQTHDICWTRLKHVEPCWNTLLLQDSCFLCLSMSLPFPSHRQGPSASCDFLCKVQLVNAVAVPFGSALLMLLSSGRSDLQTSRHAWCTPHCNTWVSRINPHQWWPKETMLELQGSCSVPCSISRLTNLKYLSLLVTLRVVLDLSRARKTPLSAQSLAASQPWFTIALGHSSKHTTSKG